MSKIDKGKHKDGGAALGPRGDAMSKPRLENGGPGQTSISHDDYGAQPHVLQVELVKLRRHFIGFGDKILVLLEGRDASGKGGSIKRIVEYLSPRDTRVVALGKPSERDIDKDEQIRRWADWHPDPLKQRKTSPFDAVAVKHWKAYSEARDATLLRTRTAIAPWRIVKADDKRLARLKLMRDILSRLPYEGKKGKFVQPNPAIAFEFTPDCIKSPRIAR